MNELYEDVTISKSTQTQWFMLYNNIFPSKNPKKKLRLSIYMRISFQEMVSVENFNQSIFTCVSNRMTSSYIHLSISFSLSPNLTNLKHQVIHCEHGMHNENTMKILELCTLRFLQVFFKIRSHHKRSKISDMCLQ